jgi:ectoine hydroxylase-related dioxygenase (phytanoyl-CoA dioxygenase family)
MTTAEQRRSWDEEGFFFVRGFADAGVLEAMLASVTRLARAAEKGQSIAPAFVQAEARIAHLDAPAEQKLSKLFRVHREHQAFHRFCCQPRLLELVTPLLGEELDCFLSQFIFKHPGAIGQPWHQDAWYFRFDRGPQVGVWLAVSESTRDNGPLWVLPGSHRERVHPVIPDRRPEANLGYFEIVDHDFEGALPVLMQPGDLLVFHSHLMHRSTDNGSDRSRAAMVFHYAEAGTVDQSQERLGFVPPNVDWMPVRRQS